MQLMKSIRRKEKRWFCPKPVSPEQQINTVEAISFRYLPISFKVTLCTQCLNFSIDRLDSIKCVLPSP